MGFSGRLILGKVNHLEFQQALGGLGVFNNFNIL
jgi:hypothetical protein